MEEIIKNKGLKNHITKNGHCMECNKQTRKFRIYQNKFLCYNCYIKKFHKIGDSGRKKISLERALNKTYEIKGYLNKKGNIYSSISFPSILIGHKVKLILLK